MRRDFFLITKRGFIGQNLSLSPAHRPDKTANTVKRDVKSQDVNPSVICHGNKQEVTNFVSLCKIRWVDVWMTCDFTSFSTVFQSYQDDGMLIMKSCVQWDSVYG